MSEQRIEAFRAMLAKNPNNPLARFGLANELLKVERYEAAIEQLEAYLALKEDEGNAYGRLAEAFVALRRTDEARSALTKGVEASRRFGHPSMANEFEARLEELEDA